MAVSVPAAGIGTNNGWVDSGVTVTACEQLTIVATGRWAWGPNPGNDAAADGDPGSGFSTPTHGIPVFGLIAYLVQDGMTPVNLPQTGFPGPPSGVLAANANVANVCTTNYSQATMVAASPVGTAPWRVWFRIADTILGDNSGAISVASTVANDPATAPTLSPTLTGSWSLNTSGCIVSNILTWTSVVGATGYEVDRDGTFLASAAGLTYTDTTALVGSAHSYTVKVVGDCGTGPASNALVLRPDPAIPAVPFTVCAPCCEVEVVVRWTAVTATRDSAGDQDAAVGYLLERATGAGSFATLKQWTAAQLLDVPLIYRDTGVSALTDYTYRMSAQYGSCWSGPTATEAIRVHGFDRNAIPATAFSRAAGVTTAFSRVAVPATTFTRKGCDCDAD